MHIFWGVSYIIYVYAIIDSMDMTMLKFTQPRFRIGDPIFTVGYPNLREYVNPGIPKFTGCVNLYDTESPDPSFLRPSPPLAHMQIYTFAEGSRNQTK